MPRTGVLPAARDLRGVRGRPAVALALALVALAIDGRDARATPTSETVLKVELRSEAPVADPAKLWERVEIVAGEPLSLARVRSSLVNLQGAAEVGSAEIRLAREKGGVRVFVIVAPKLVVASVDLEGALCLRRSRLKARIQQLESTPLSESRVVRSVYRLEETLSEAGYREAVVRVAVDVDETARLAHVRYVVDCGEPTVVEAIRFEGDLGPFTAEELATHLRLRAGERLRQERLGEERERLESWLIRSHFSTAKVEAPSQSPGSEPRRVVLTYAVDVGPAYEIVVEGVEERALERKNLLDLLRQERFDEALQQQVMAGIRRGYQEEGHYRVRVASHSEPGADSVRLIIRIEPGEVFEVVALTFRGNERLSARDLASRMTTSPARPLVLGSGRLVDDRLEDDLSNLRSYYALQGFGSARVGPAEVTVQGKELAVEIPVVEGPRRRVVDLSFTGVEEPKVAATLSDLPLEPGGPFHQRLLEESLDEIRARYEDAGYLSAQVDAVMREELDATRISVVVSVIEGPRVEVGRVLLRGNARTRDHVIRRTLGIRPGDVVSRRRLLDGQRRLYQLGALTRADVRLLPGMPFSPRRDVLVRVEEGRTQRGLLGVGYDSEDGLRGLIGYSHVNIDGRGISARFEYRVSEREELFRALLRQPFAGRFQIPVTYSLFAVEEERESFESRRRGAQIEAHRLWDSSRAALLYSYRIVQVGQKPGVSLSQFDIDRNLQEAEIASLTPSVLLDRRDDPLIPTRGWTLNLQTEVAFPLFAAEAEFLKLFGQYTAYVPLGRSGVVAGSLRLGAIEDLAAEADDPATLVPISEQFFAGGRSTHRAYRRDLLGILGETVLFCREDEDVCVGELPPEADPDEYRRLPLGGNGLFLFNLDYRFPLVGSFGGTLFVDAGNVWANWRDLDPADIELGAGVGLRYLSPVGPLRLEVGWKLDRDRDESSPVAFLSFGNPF